MIEDVLPSSSLGSLRAITQQLRHLLLNLFRLLFQRPFLSFQRHLHLERFRIVSLLHELGKRVGRLWTGAACVPSLKWSARQQKRSREVCGVMYTHYPNPIKGIQRDGDRCYGPLLWTVAMDRCY